MYSKKKDQIKEYWSKKIKFDKRLPNSEVFQILSNYSLKFKKKYFKIRFWSWRTFN